MDPIDLVRHLHEQFHAEKADRRSTVEGIAKALNFESLKMPNAVLAPAAVRRLLDVKPGVYFEKQLKVLVALSVPNPGKRDIKM